MEISLFEKYITERLLEIYQKVLKQEEYARTNQRIIDLQMKIKQIFPDQDRYLIAELEEAILDNESIGKREIYISGFLDGTRLVSAV